MRNINLLNEKELSLGLIGKGSWHEEFKNSPYIYIGNLPLDIEESYLRSIFAQWGTINDLDMIKDRESKKFKGFAFLSYSDIRSTIMAIDNFNSISISTPSSTSAQKIKVDHVLNYEKKKDKPSYDHIINKALLEVSGGSEINKSESTDINTTATTTVLNDAEAIEAIESQTQRLREEKEERKRKRKELRIKKGKIKP